MKSDALHVERGRRPAHPDVAAVGVVRIGRAHADVAGDQVDRVGQVLRRGRAGVVATVVRVDQWIEQRHDGPVDRSDLADLVLRLKARLRPVDVPAVGKDEPVAGVIVGTQPPERDRLQRQRAVPGDGLLRQSHERRPGLCRVGGEAAHDDQAAEKMVRVAGGEGGGRQHRQRHGDADRLRSGRRAHLEQPTGADDAVHHRQPRIDRRIKSDRTSHVQHAGQGSVPVSHYDGMARVHLHAVGRRRQASEVPRRGRLIVARSDGLDVERRPEVRPLRAVRQRHRG